MAAGDFQAQVEGLTSLTISATPTLLELTEFLRDGVNDVTNRWLAVRAQDVMLFQRESDIIDSNSGFDAGGSKIISVIREAGADGSSDNSTAWRQCRQVSVGQKSRVVDPDSLSFASKYNPVYIINDNGKINVYPVADSTNDGYRVYYVNNEPKDNTNGAALTYAHSDIRWFPNDKVYLVVLYAAIKSLEAQIAVYTVDEEDLELVQGLSASLASLKQEYDTAFAIAAPRPAQ